MNVPHPIPYQGSKRGIASYILKYFPGDVETLIEPFAGSAAVSLAVACHRKARRFAINDVNEPLIKLWDQMINHPQKIAAAYEKLWHNQQGKEREFYDDIRIRFNQTQRADYLLYLLARCVKAAVRYNSNGEFNQSPDNRRKGALPSTMLSQIVGASSLLKGRTALAWKDYREIVRDASVADLVYLDPPYQGVCDGRDRRYAQPLSYDSFVATLEELNGNNVSFIVSYDGRTGAKKFGKHLPSSLCVTHIEIKAGKSSQATLLGRNEDTFESLYLSSALVERIGTPLEDLEAQSTLFPYRAEQEATSGLSETSAGCNEQTA
jgi:DNA adenine methylase